MKENRKAARRVVHVPLHIGSAKDGLPEYHAGQLGDISRTGILFQPQKNSDMGASSNALRVSELPGGTRTALRNRRDH
jgi:hypothetical protein